MFCLPASCFFCSRTISRLRCCSTLFSRPNCLLRFSHWNFSVSVCFWIIAVEASRDSIACRRSSSRIGRVAPRSGLRRMGWRAPEVSSLVYLSRSVGVSQLENAEAYSASSSFDSKVSGRRCFAAHSTFRTSSKAESITSRLVAMSLSLRIEKMWSVGVFIIVVLLRCGDYEEWEVELGIRQLIPHKGHLLCTYVDNCIEVCTIYIIPSTFENHKSIDYFEL